jgi:hypothetical protein
MFKNRSLLTVLLGYALLGVAAHAADGPAPADPDAGFLEFLGGVDGLADVNPNYLAQANPATAGPSAPATAPAKPPPPPPPPPPASAAGVKNNE